MTKRTSFAVALGVAAAFACSDARAADPSPSSKAADSLFKEARSLMDAKSYAAACPKFAESQRLEPAAGTLLNLADCYEKNGQTATAYTTFKDAAKAAAIRNRNDWVSTATQRAALLEPKLSTLTITVAPAAAAVSGLHVERDGVPVERDAWGTPVPVDPGAHVVVATAPGKKGFTAHYDILAAKKMTSDVPVLEAEPAGADERRLASEDLHPEKKKQEESSDGSTTRIVGYALAGVGVVGLAVGTITGLRALSLRSDAASHCDSYPDRCGPDASGPNHDAKTMSTISTITLIAGAALVVGGFVLVLTAPSGHADDAQKKSAVLRLLATPGGLAF